MSTPSSPKIVIVNDEPGPLRSCELIIRRFIQDADLVLFQDSTEARQHLAQFDPDLLITGTWFPRLRGKELVGELMERKAAYPIIVMSAYEPEELWVTEYSSRGLNIKFLSLPFDVAALHTLVAASLKLPICRQETPPA